MLKQEFAKEDIKLEHHDSAKFEEWLLADQDDLDKRLNSENVKSLIDFKGRSLASFKLLTARDRYRLGAEKIAQQGPQELPAFVRLPLWDIDLSQPLPQILSRPGHDYISRYVYHSHGGADSLGVPTGYAAVNYDFAPALMRLVVKMVNMVNSGKMVQVPITDELHAFCLKFGALLDQSYAPNLATAASSASAARAKGEEEASSKEYRANRHDASFMRTSIPISEVEDKPSAEAAACDPYMQLEMSRWLPHHSNLRWRLGIVKDYECITFVPMRKVRHGNSFRTKVDRSEAVEVPMGARAWESLHVLVNVAALIRKLADQVHLITTAAEWVSRMRQAQNPVAAEGLVQVWVNPDYVHKYYEKSEVVERLKEFYAATSAIEGLEHVAQDHQHNHKTSAGIRRVFVLEPVGIPANYWRFNEDDCKNLQSQLTATLHALHKVGWVHLDIRSHNVVLWEPFSAECRWFLVDSEYVQRIGQPVPKKRYTEEYENQPATPEHDFMQLEAMMRKLRPKKRTVEGTSK